MPYVVLFGCMQKLRTDSAIDRPERIECIKDAFRHFGRIYRENYRALDRRFVGRILDEWLTYEQYLAR